MLHSSSVLIVYTCLCSHIILYLWYIYIIMNGIEVCVYIYMYCYDVLRMIEAQSLKIYV